MQNVEEIIKEIEIFNTTYKDIKNILPELYELIMGAARTVIRIRPLKDHNTGPKIAEDKRKN